MLTAPVSSISSGRSINILQVPSAAWCMSRTRWAESTLATSKSTQVCKVHRTGRTSPTGVSKSKLDPDRLLLHGKQVGRGLHITPLRAATPSFSSGPSRSSHVSSEHDFQQVQLHVESLCAQHPNKFRFQSWEAVKKMSRLHNTIPSMLLVIIGAWAATEHKLNVLLIGPVWLMAVMSSAISAASMVVNDYFDYISGADQINSPDKELPAGRITPDLAVLFSSVVYILVLIAACTMEPGALRLLVAASAGTTLLYTPVLKKMTGVKNMVVAFVIASALVAGGLAAGMEPDGLKRLVAPTCFVFCSIVYREILMDISDVAGDAAAGVSTLPVVVGPPLALNIASGCALVGAAAALWALWVAAAVKVAAAGATGGLVAAAMWIRVLTCAGLVVGATARLLALDLKIRRAGFDLEAVAEAVDKCRVPIALSAIFLAAASP